MKWFYSEFLNLFLLLLLTVPLYHGFNPIIIICLFILFIYFWRQESCYVTQDVPELLDSPSCLHARDLPASSLSIRVLAV